MPAQIDCLIRYIRRIASPATSDTDAALLNRFLTNRDSEAFAALVRRHGSLILCVCRRLLSDSHDAEDAFQATFLVLARKASSVRPASALAAWLHGVAYRIALRLRGARARRRQREVPISELALPGRFSDPLAELSTRETLCILHEEVQRLPQVYRLPVILCCLEGLSQEEAARRLGWTAGTVKGRLERGRKQLHERLVKRGLTLMAALAAAEIARGTVTAGLVHALVPTTTQSAVLFLSRSGGSTGLSPQVVLWAEGALKVAMAAKLKGAAALVLTLSILMAGAGLVAYQGLGGKPADTKAVAKQEKPLPSPPVTGEASKEPEKSAQDMGSPVAGEVSRAVSIPSATPSRPEPCPGSEVCAGGLAATPNSVPWSSLPMGKRSFPAQAARPSAFWMRSPAEKYAGLRPSQVGLLRIRTKGFPPLPWHRTAKR